MLNFIRNLIAYWLLSIAQKNLTLAKRIYAEHEGTDFGQRMGDFAMARFRFYQAYAVWVTGE